MTDEQTNVEEFTDDDKVESTFHNFDEHPEVVGTLTAVEPGVYGNQYKIREGKVEILVGSYDVLKSKIALKDVGKRIKIVFNGLKLSPQTKRNYKDFTVYLKD